MKKQMAYNLTEVRKFEPAKTNTTVLELIFLFFIIVLILATGTCYLNIAPDRSYVQDEALGIYNQHRMKLDQLSKKYYGESVSANKKIESIGDY